MRIVIAGGHGKIAMRLTRLLHADGDEVVSLIRNPEHADEVRGAGAEPVVCDLEAADDDAVAQAIAGCDAVVFAAGAGPGSGSPRKDTMDYGDAAKLIRAAGATGVGRYLMISSMGADPDAAGDDTFTVYQRAKGRADAELMESGLDWTIVRPGRLTDDPGTGRVTLADSVERGEISRDDVALVLRACLDEPRTAGRVFELVGGDVPVDEAVASMT